MQVDIYTITAVVCLILFLAGMVGIQWEEINHHKKELTTIRLRHKVLKNAVAWVLFDADCKAPEEIGDVPARWVTRLRLALRDFD